MTNRLPAKSGYEEVEIGDYHTYRNITNGFILQGEIDMMPSASESDLANLASAIIGLIKQRCMDSIYMGFEDDAKGEFRHYSLSDVHQTDMENIMKVIDSKDIIYWRDSSRVMYEEYTSEEFKHLYKDAAIYKTINKLYSDGLEQMVLAALENEDVTAMRSVVWGVELTDNIRTEVDKQVLAIERITQEELDKFKKDRDIEI